MPVVEDFVKRQNDHQTHFESLVLLGPGGLEELDDKIESALEELEDKSSGKLNLTTKIDGCLAPETLVATTEGDIPFSKIISDYKAGKIYYGYGVDDTTNDIVEVELQFPRVTNGFKDWCSVTFDNGGYILATVDHPIKVADKYIEIGALQPGEKIDGVVQF